MNTAPIDYSWINFKLDRRTHATLTFILKIKQLHLKDFMGGLVTDFVKENTHLLSTDHLKGKDGFFIEECDSCQ